MSYPAKTNRNEEIMKYREEEGRTYDWIGKQMGIAMGVVRKIYFRELENRRRIKRNEAAK